MQRRMTGRKKKRGPRHVIEVSWAIGKLFFYFLKRYSTKCFFACRLCNIAPYDGEKEKRCPRHVNNVSWAVSDFFYVF